MYRHKMARVLVILMAMILFVILAASALADTIGVNFESYTIGNINGQDGWSKIGPFDAVVVDATPYGYAYFGSQSLRISNAVTSGSFSDQTFSKPTVNEAGETSAANGGMSGGTRQPVFMASWDFASTVPGAEQPGLAITASPDRGDGARMSWIQMVDTPTGLGVNFYDYDTTNGGTCNDLVNFEYYSLVNDLDRTIPHSIRVTIQFVDGINNDILKLYVDNVLLHTGTTWEDYFHNCESAPSSRTVDSVLFRSSGTSAPATSGNGFLIDNFTTASCAGLVTNVDTNEAFCSIQAAIDDADTLNGHTLDISAGTYVERVTVNKSLTLHGAGVGSDPATDTILDGTTLGAGASGIQVLAGITDVTIEDLTVQNYVLNSSNYAGISAAGNNNNFTAQRLWVKNNTAGRGGLYLNGPVDTVLIDQVTAHNNQGRGIVIWNGFKQHITITNNDVQNNICCGIELQDGTASGVTVTGNTVQNNADSGMAFIGLTSGAGPNLIANNTLTDNGRFGMEIKLPNGTGLTSGDGSIVVENNTVSRTATPATELRDLAGIAVYRRGWLAGNANIPTGVIVRNNTVSGYQQPSTSDGFGIVVEGMKMTVSGNTLNTNDVGVQVQAGHLPYTANTNTDGDQSNLADQYFGRGNTPTGCGATLTGNTFSGNTTDTRTVGPAGGGSVTNINTSETFCSIQAAVDDSDTVNGHTIDISAGTFVEQVEVTKELTLKGAGVSTIIQSPATLTKFFQVAGGPKNYPIVYVHGVSAVTIQDLVVDGAGKGNANYRFQGIGYHNAGGVISNVEIKDVRDTPFSGSQHGVALYAYNEDAAARTLEVKDSTIHDYQKNGVTLGGPGLTVNVHDSTVTGYGPTTVTAQNGIQVSYGATGTVGPNNQVSGVSYTPSNWVASGVLIYDADVTVTTNTVTNAQVGIYLYEGSATIEDNTVTASEAGVGTTTFSGITVVDPPGRLPSPYLEEGSGHAQAAVAPQVVDTVTVSGNTITGSCTPNAYGLEAYANYYGANDTALTVTNNTLANWGYGVVLMRCTGGTCSAGTLTSTQITDNTITNACEYGMYIEDLAQAFTLQDNTVSLSQQLTAAPAPTVGIFLGDLSGPVPTIQANDVSGGFYGYLLHNVNTAGPATVTGGTVTGVMQGVAVVNSLDNTNFFPTSFAVDGVTISGFAGNYPVAPPINFHAGVYVFTGGSSAAANVTGTLTNLNIEGTGKISPDSAALYFGDFSTAAGPMQTMTVSDSTLSNNLNRGVFARGAHATVLVEDSVLTNNGADPYTTGGNDGYAVIARNGAAVTVQNNTITNPATQTSGVSYAFHASVTGSSLLVRGNQVSNGNIFQLTSGTNTLAYANNITGFTNANLPGSGTVNARHNWWGTYGSAPTGVDTDSWDYRLGAVVGSWGLGTLGGASLTSAGGTGEGVIVSHGRGLANVPFGKGSDPAASDMCSDYYDFFVINASGNWTVSVPTDAGSQCDPTRATKNLYHFALTNTTMPDAICVSNLCWLLPAPVTLNGSNLESTLDAATMLLGTPFAAGNTTPTGAPLTVMLAGFEATQQDNIIRLVWETATELDNRGFNLYRGTSAEGWDRQLNTTLIPSQAQGSPGGFVYAWDDQADLVNNQTYVYWLQDVSVGGVATLHGPVTVTFSTPTAVTLKSLQTHPAASALPTVGAFALLAAGLAMAALRRRA
ncbi:MAG: right-handed parallel beta-helix repeat-containing protein [Anaerolineae bacterium]